MSAPVAIRWSELPNRIGGPPPVRALASWLAVPGFALLGAFAPAALLGLSVAVGLVALLWRRPRVAGLLVIALMGNVKVNFYTGFITLFPEYVVLLAAGVVWALRQLETPTRPRETEVLWWLGVWTLVGLASVAFAHNLPRVLSKSLAIPVAAGVFLVTVSSIRERRDLERAMNWLTCSMFIVAAYGVVQMAGVLTGIDRALRFIGQWGNPEFEYGIGAPVVESATYTFRANSLFNDPNILAGCLAAVIPLLAARVLTPGAIGVRAKLVWEAVVLAVSMLTLTLTLSRTGFVGATVGLVAALACLPSAQRSSRLWIGFTLTMAVAVGAASAIGVDALLLIGRLAAAFDGTEYSAQVHQSVFMYGLDLFARHPLTGVGLRNFGEYFGREIDAVRPNMMAHNVWIGTLAESGIFGFGALCMVSIAIVRRPWHVLRAGSGPLSDDAHRATIAGLFGSLIALGVSNVFYDFSLRTFVWVFAGMAVAASALTKKEAVT